MVQQSLKKITLINAKRQGKKALLLYSCTEISILSFDVRRAVYERIASFVKLFTERTVWFKNNNIIKNLCIKTIIVVLNCK